MEQRGQSENPWSQALLFALEPSPSLDSIERALAMAKLLMKETNNKKRLAGYLLRVMAQWMVNVEERVEERVEGAGVDINQGIHCGR